MYYAQERLIFHPTTLSQEHRFSFGQPYTEIWFDASGVSLHGLRFPHKKSRGVIVYFHGNAGSLDSWGHVATDLRSFPYEVWIYDYRGYGKSGGTITSEEQLHTDARAFLQEVRRVHPDTELIFYGRSLGSGIAANLAQEFAPKMLILETPYYNFPDVVSSIYPFVPSFLVRYKLRTDLSLLATHLPVHLLHGTRDELIPYDSSVRLAKLRQNITLHTFEGGGHNNLPSYKAYRDVMTSILER